VTDTSSSVSLNQENGIIKQTQALFVFGDSLGEDLPDGTHVALEIQSYNAEYDKDETNNLILGYLPKLDKDVWHLICLMRIETILVMKESFRHWQKTKIGDVFVFATLSGKPEDLQDQGQIWLRDINIKFPEATR
jgi:hypothetical protein